MLELKLVVAYVLGLAVVVAAAAGGALYSAVETLEFAQTEANLSAVKKELSQSQHEPYAGRRDGPPVWIAPTPKYDYDPKLMVVKSRDERMREAELKRGQEAAKHRAQIIAARTARQKAAKRRAPQIFEQGTAHAYQPERRTPFGLFSLFH